MRPAPGNGSVGEPPERDADVLRRGLSLLAERLPPGWSIRLTGEGTHDRSVDALVDLVAPDRRSAVFIVEIKRAVVTRDLPGLLERLLSAGGRGGERRVPLLAARYLGSSVRSWLEDRGVSYVDATGNLHVVVDSPALFLHDRGADRDPWRGPGRPRGTLEGAAAARVVRALVDFTPPLTVPELVRRSGASTGATYRVVEFLEREALVQRDRRGPITDVEWRRVLERWSQDYGFQRSNRVGGYLCPRGLPALLDTLRASSELLYVVTGSLAAHRLAPYAPARLAMIYVDDRARAAEHLKLRAVDSGANVLLATAAYPVVFDRAIEDEGLRHAAPSQIVVDLLTGPGRTPAEAQALLEWMERHEPVWRR